MTMGGGGVKNPEKLMTSFMNAAQYGAVSNVLKVKEHLL